MGDAPQQLDTSGGAAPRPCPICGKPPIDAYAPFCSKRCADVDLHRWLGGVYVVPSEDPADGETSSGDEES